MTIKIIVYYERSQTPILTERLEAVTIGQQGTDRFSGTLPAHFLCLLIKKAVGDKVWTPFCFDILKIQLHSKNGPLCLSENNVLAHIIAMC